MNKPELIFTFLKRNAPKAYCDNSLETLVDIKGHAQVRTIAASLGLCNKEFWRGEGICAHCGSTNKLVTKAL